MNRESYPSALFPLRGDLSAEAGATKVEVTGLQNIPLKANPLTDGTVPTYVAANGDIEWLAGGGGVLPVLINGTPSGDYLIMVNTAITVNYGSDDFIGVRINGTLDGGL
jgi:hypothetical protein